MPKLLDRRWEGSLTGFGGRRSRSSFRYQAYLPDPLRDLELALPADIAAVTVDAETAIRRLNETSPALQSLEGLARQLLRAESVASSRIEGLELSHRRLAKAAYTHDSQDLTAASVLANMRAMEVAVQRATATKPFTQADILAIHRELFSAFGDERAGQLREEQNWIGGASSGPRDAEFVPPPPEYVANLLDDLCDYLDRDDLPAVMQAAIVHAQFETIHPFADGNGRVGRCLIHVVLRRRGVAPSFVPPVSLILATDAKAYVRGLTDFRAGNAVEWCALFAQAARTSATEAYRFADDIEKLKSRWRDAAGNPRRDSATSALIDLLPSHPLLDVSTAEKLLGKSNQATRLAMLQLDETGVLSSISVGRRNRAWEAIGLFEVMNAFEARLASKKGGKTRLRPAPR